MCMTEQESRRGYILRTKYKLLLTKEIVLICDMCSQRINVFFTHLSAHKQSFYGSCMVASDEVKTDIFSFIVQFENIVFTAYITQCIFNLII